jgi:hypothetical protein
MTSPPKENQISASCFPYFKDRSKIFRLLQALEVTHFIPKKTGAIRPKQYCPTMSESDLSPLPINHEMEMVPVGSVLSQTRKHKQHKKR